MDLPDLILYNARLYTQDPRFPRATALASGCGRCLAVGSDAEILALAGPHTRRINLHGRRVLPGLIDAHFHFREWALMRRGLRLAGVPSLATVLDRVQQAAQATPPGQWIIGQGWNESAWPEARLITRHDLDQVAPDHPVLLKRSDLHLACANSLALRLAGISDQTPDPEGGVIDRDQHGQPTGVLRELAIEQVNRVVPPLMEEETEILMREAMAEAHRLGLTGIHDLRLMNAEEGRVAFHAWQRLRSAGDLYLRVWMMLPGGLLDEAIALGLRSGFGDDRLRIGGLKLFADGSLGARTAWMSQPYSDGGTGLPITPMTEIADKIARAHAAGISVAAHAIGDRAIRELLDVFAEVLQRPAERVTPLTPHRIEHVQHSHPEDLRRLAALGLVASVQPIHLVDDMDLVAQALDEERARWTYAFRTLRDAGVVLALGSDCPVADPNPFLGIHAAVTRQRQDGTPTGGWHPEQRLSVAEAVQGYTLGPAIASGQVDRLGTLSPGKLADLIVLDRDIFSIPAQEIGATQVVMTVFDGRIMFQGD